MKYLSLFILIIFLSSCDKEEGDFTLQIGSEYLDVNTKVFFIDTSTIKASTFQFDSIDVSGASRLLIGGYYDPIFGMVKSKSFIQLTNYNYYVDNDAVYDSIVLVLNYDNYYYNDTILPQKFKVYELIDDLEPDEGYYYNTTDFKYKDTPIAEKIFLPRPYGKDSLNIRISDDFGINLFNKIKDNDINNIGEFLDEYKGLMIESGTISTSVLGFSKNSYLKIYFTDGYGLQTIERTLNFEFNPSNTFNQIKSDKIGTHFEKIKDRYTILQSKDTDNSNFIQAGTGVLTRIDIPYIKTINDIGDGIIIDAKLKFTLKQNTYTDNLYTRDSLKVFIIDSRSNVLGDLTFDGEKPVLSFIENINSEFETNTYTLDIKQFIALKQTETNDEFFLAIYPKDFNSSVDRYVFNGDQASNDVKIKLELTYAVYSE